MTYGDWTALVRVLGGHDLDRQDQIIKWPLRDALLAYQERIRNEAKEDYRWERIEYLLQAPWQKKGSTLKPPQLPEILKD